MAEQDNSLMGESVFGRIGFTLLVIIMFFILLRIGILVLSYINGPKREITLIPGMINGNQAKSYSVNPNKSGSFPIFRSDDEDKGLEYTWSFWLHLDELIFNDSQEGNTYHVWNEGNIEKMVVNDDYFSKNGPGVYLQYNQKAEGGSSANEINMKIVIDTDPANQESYKVITINNLSSNKWMNIIIRAEHDKIDVFVEGTLIQRTVFEKPLRQNYSDVYACQMLPEKGNEEKGNPGFSGRLSGLKYYDRAIGTTKIMDIQNSGPELTYITSDNYDTVSSYFSHIWYNSALSS